MGRNEGVHLVEQENVDLGAVMILNGHDRPRGTVLLGEAAVHARDEAAERDLRAVAQLARQDRGQLGVGLRSNRLLEPVERVARDVQAEHLAFQRELVLLVPLVVRNVHGEHGRATLLPVVSAEAGE